MKLVHRSTELADSLTISQKCGSGQKGVGRISSSNLPTLILRSTPEVVPLELLQQILFTEPEPGLSSRPMFPDLSY
jgi:hypothetical protein